VKLLLAGGGSAVARLASAAARALGLRRTVRILGDSAERPDDVLEADRRLYERIGFEPRVSIEEGMTLLANSRRKPPPLIRSR